MIVIYKNKRLHNIQGIFRFNLAFSDCLCSFVFIGSAVAPYYYVFSPNKFKNLDFNNHQRAQKFFNESSSDDNFESFFLNVFKIDPIDNFYVTFFGFVCYSAGLASMYSYLVASIDRFIAIKYPFKYKRKASKSKANKACVLVWLFAITFTLIPVLNNSMYFFFSQTLFIFYKGKYEIFIDLVYHILPLVFCWILNILTLVSIRNSKKKMIKVLSTVELRNRNYARMSKFETRVNSAAKTISIMVFTFTISFLPYNIHVFLYQIYSHGYVIYNGVELHDKHNFENNSGLLYIFCVILLYNNFWNFFIYQVRDPQFRKYTKSLVCRFRTR